MRTLVTYNFVLEIDDYDELCAMTLKLERSVREALRDSIATALGERPDLGVGDVEEVLEWYGVGVLPMRSLEAELEDSV